MISSPAVPRPIPSPNIWHWPDVYEIENRAQDVDGSLWAAMRARVDWSGRDVVDVGCGAGFHLPEFARTARRVVGVEPHAPLVKAARDTNPRFGVDRRSPGFSRVHGSGGCFSRSRSYARTAYFFGKGCGPGIREAMRILRPGGVLLIVDLDVSAGPYGEVDEGGSAQIRSRGGRKRSSRLKDSRSTRVDTRWEFENRDDMRRVLGIEFTEKTAERAFSQVTGLGFTVRYRIHVRVQTTITRTCVKAGSKDERQALRLERLTFFCTDSVVKKSVIGGDVEQGGELVNLLRLGELGQVAAVAHA